MISGKKCRHLNRDDVDIGKRESSFRLSYLTTYLFLRHNHLTCFLLSHNLRLYRLTCRNQTRLVCRRCYDPYAELVWMCGSSWGNGRKLARGILMDSPFEEQAITMILDPCFPAAASRQRVRWLFFHKQNYFVGNELTPNQNAHTSCWAIISGYC